MKQHHHVKLSPKEDKIKESKEILLKCKERILAKKNENGPISWNLSWNEEEKFFYIDAYLTDDQSVKFHQENIKDIVQEFGMIVRERPTTIISEVCEMI